MLVSQKQHEANQRNAQLSTGPKTPEGKAAVKFNAFTWGLRARNLMIDADDPADYQELWDGLTAEWQPQTHTERHYVEQMCVSQWLLIRVAVGERHIHERPLTLKVDTAGHETVLYSFTGGADGGLPYACVIGDSV